MSPNASPLPPAHTTQPTSDSLPNDGKRPQQEPHRPQSAMAACKRANKAASNANPKPARKTASKTAPKAALAPPRSGTRSSGRTRKAPDRFSNLAPPPQPRSATPRKAGNKVFERTYITTNSNSRLKRTDLFHMLLKDNAWTCLSSDQKLEILALLPKNPTNVHLADELSAGTATDKARPKEFSLNFNLFRTDVAKFKEDLENGHLAKTWQTSAEQAVRHRAAGAFDDWKEREAELWWGQN